MTRRRGERGPSKERQLVERAISRRLGKDPDDPHWAELIHKGRVNRAVQQQQAAHASQRWPAHAYRCYQRHLEEGASPAGDGILIIDAPGELDDAPASKHRWPPSNVARWAYLHRREGQSYPTIARDEEKHYSAGAGGTGARRRAAVEQQKAALPTSFRSQRDKEEVAILDARAELIAPSKAAATPAPSAEAIRQAVRRYERIWQLAEQDAPHP